MYSIAMGRRRAADTYVAMFDRIAADKLDGNISLKLTQLGLDLDPELCETSLLRIADCAAARRNFVRVDMEGSPYTQRTVDLVRRVRARTDALGTVIQSYLFRSEQDVRDLIAAQCRIRLVKGAYKEPAEIAFPAKSDVDANFVSLMKILLPSGIYHAIATHDPRMIQATKEFASRAGNRQGQIRISDAVWDSHGFAEILAERGVSRAGLYSVWDGLVSLFHAALGGAASEFEFLPAQFFPLEPAYHKPAWRAEGSPVDPHSKGRHPTTAEFRNRQILVGVTGQRGRPRLSLFLRRFGPRLQQRFNNLIFTLELATKSSSLKKSRISRVTTYISVRYRDT